MNNDESQAVEATSTGSEAAPGTFGGIVPGACPSMRPWRIDGNRIVAADGDVVAEFEDSDNGNAELIVKAVNAFQAPGPCYPPMRETLPSGARVNLIEPGAGGA